MNGVIECRVLRGVRTVASGCAALLLCVFAAMTAHAVDDTWGKPGDPINLSVGYQPYFTESWSGPVVRALKLDEKYLPAGSHVEYRVGISGGGVLLRSLQSGQTQLAYLGLMPTVTGATSRQVADLRIVAVAGQSDDICNQVLVRSDYAVPTGTAAALQWLNNKHLGVPSGTCADLFVTHLLSANHLHVAGIYDQNFDLLATSFRSHSIDAAVIWEPAASALQDAGLARAILSGKNVGESSASFIVVSAELLQRRPDVVRAWLRAERDAQAFIANPANADRVIGILQMQTTNYSAAVLRHALYGDPGIPIAARVRFPFVVKADVRALLGRTAQFLYDNKRIPSAQLPADALQPALANQLSSDRGGPVLAGAR